MITVILVAKEPIAGKVKTRLCPPLDGTQASELAKCALHDTMKELGNHKDIKRVLYVDGEIENFNSKLFKTIHQVKGELGVRLSHVFSEVEEQYPCAVIAMDTPQFEFKMFEEVDFTIYDAFIGFTKDGGYWTIGFKRPSLAEGAFDEIQMSTKHTGSDQLERLKKLGIKVQILNSLTDFDDIESARELANEFPNLTFSKYFQILENELDK